MICKIIKRLVNKLSCCGALKWIPDKPFLCFVYRIYTGKRLHLAHPATYNEKLQWLKLYDKNPAYTAMVDKYLAKDYVKEMIGEQYIIPLLGVWESADDIDFDALPDKFVLKCNHDSGSTIICTDKNNLDRTAVRKKLNRHMKVNNYNYAREWPYKNVVRRIIAEEYIANPNVNDLYDYKVYCFSGEPKFMMVNTSRRSGKTTANYYDSDYNLMDFTWGYPRSETIVKIPKEKFDELFEKAKVLSTGLTHIRVDFYEADGRLYFGELTFFDGSGFSLFDPPEWDEIIGSWIELPAEKRNDSYDH